MKPFTLLIPALAAGTLTGCSAFNYARNVVAPQPGYSVEFVAGNRSAVVIDYDSQPAGELKYADAMGKDKCAAFGKSSAVLESINTRSDDRMRASYLCE